MYRNLENNQVYGKIPNFKNLLTLNSCFFRNTKLCYVEEEKNTNCYYPESNTDCQNCVENASVIDGICQCNDGYFGIGYIECTNGI